MMNFKELKEIKGDASFRKFYRNKNNYSMVVYAKKEKVKNLLKLYDQQSVFFIKMTSKHSLERKMNDIFRHQFNIFC